MKTTTTTSTTTRTARTTPTRTISKQRLGLACIVLAILPLYQFVSVFVVLQYNNNSSSNNNNRNNHEHEQRRHRRRGWIADIATWALQQDNNENDNYNDINDTTIRLLQAYWPQFHLLNDSKPDFNALYRHIRGYPQGHANDGVVEQHIVPLQYAAALYHDKRFQIVHQKEQIDQQITSNDIVFLYFGNLLAYEPSRQFVKTNYNRDLHVMPKVMAWLQQQSWIATKGKNCITVMSFPETWPFLPWPYTQAQVLVSETRSLPNPKRPIDKQHHHLIPYNLVRNQDTQQQQQQQQDQEQRTTLVLMNSRCNQTGSPGKRLRHYLVQHYQNEYQTQQSDANYNIMDMDISCNVTQQSQHHKGAHKSYANKLQRAVYCLVLAGDTLSSLRISETIAHGCIPVIVGPPWHVLFSLQPYHHASTKRAWWPLTWRRQQRDQQRPVESLDWSQISIHLYVRNHTEWYKSSSNNSKNNQHIPKRALVVENVNDIYDVLRRHYASNERVRLQAGVQAARTKLVLPPHNATKQQEQEVDYFPTPPYVTDLLHYILESLMEYDDTDAS